MADSKLPVIYARKRFCVPYESGLGLVPAYTRAPNPAEEQDFAAYEQAVPKCVTCRHNQYDCDDDRSWRYCELFEGDDTPFPQDGSGYCFAHKPRST